MNFEYLDLTDCLTPKEWTLLTEKRCRFSGPPNHFRFHIFFTNVTDSRHKSLPRAPRHTAHWSEMGNLKRKLFLMKQCSHIWLLHTTGLLRHQGSQKNCKRPMKIKKAKSKARHYQKSKFYSFFHLFGVTWSWLIRNLLWFEFQGHKGRKGRYNSSKSQIKFVQLYRSKFGLPKILAININAPHPI